MAAEHLWGQHEVSGLEETFWAMGIKPCLQLLFFLVQVALAIYQHGLMAGDRLQAAEPMESDFMAGRGDTLGGRRFW